MKKFSFFVRAVCITLVLVVLALPVSAASALSVDDFVQVFNTDAIVGEKSEGISLTFGGEGRVTYMKPVELDGLKIVMKQVSFREPTEEAPVSLWMTFSQEAGHYWGDQATGTIVRLENFVNGVAAYVKRADDMDDKGDDIFLESTAIGLKGFPITMTLTVNKVDDKYEFALNGYIFRVDAKSIDDTMSESGKCFWNIGAVDYAGYTENSLIVTEITNTKTDAPATTTTAGNTTEPTAPSTQPAPSGMNTLIVVLIAVFVVFIVAATVVIVILLKKNQKVK